MLTLFQQEKVKQTKFKGVFENWKNYIILTIHYMMARCDTKHSHSFNSRNIISFEQQFLLMHIFL